MRKGWILSRTRMNAGDHDEQAIEQLSEHKVHGRHGFIESSRQRTAETTLLNPLIDRHVAI